MSHPDPITKYGLCQYDIRDRPKYSGKHYRKKRAQVKKIRRREIKKRFRDETKEIILSLLS